MLDAIWCILSWSTRFFLKMKMDSFSCIWSRESKRARTPRGAPLVCTGSKHGGVCGKGWRCKGKGKAKLPAGKQKGQSRGEQSTSKSNCTPAILHVPHVGSNYSSPASQPGKEHQAAAREGSIHVVGGSTPTERHGGEGEAARQGCCQGPAGATVHDDNQEARAGDEGGGGLLPHPQPPPGAPALDGGHPRLPARPLPARCDWPAGRPERERHGRQVFLVLQEELQDWVRVARPVRGRSAAAHAGHRVRPQGLRAPVRPPVKAFANCCLINSTNHMSNCSALFLSQLLPDHIRTYTAVVSDHHQRKNDAEDGQPCKPAPRQDSPPSPGSSNQGWASKSPSPTPATHPAVPAIKEAVPPSPPPPPPTTAPAALVPAMKEHAPPQPVSPSMQMDEEQCRLPSHLGSSSNSSSPKTSMASSSGASSPSPTKPATAAAAAGSDAATQTDDKAKWDDVRLQCGQGSARASSSPEGPEIVVDEESRCTRAPAGEHHPRSRRSGTLQSLIRAEAAGRRRALPLPEEDDRAAAAATGGSVSGRLKPANLLMRLMACGPNHPGFGLVQSSSSYGPPRFAQLEYPSSPELSPLCALKPGTTGASTVRASETENCSGRLLDGALKLSSSSSSRSHHEGIVCEQEAWPKQGNLSRSASKRTSDPSSGRMASSSKVVSFRDDE